MIIAMARSRLLFAAVAGSIGDARARARAAKKAIATTT
jgi:hypothetical protein